MDAQAIQDHGTHTAGIAAGVTGKTAVVNGVEIDDMSGIAPGAWLGNYNVFPGDVLSARSEDILNAVDEAIEDGMDVLNLSLGGGYHGNNDLLAIGLDNAVDAGLVVAVAAGNSGPGQGTFQSPGRRARSSRLEGEISISSVSRLPIQRAAERRSAPQLVTSIHCLPPPLICSILSWMVAPASIPVLRQVGDH